MIANTETEDNNPQRGKKQELFIDSLYCGARLWVYYCYNTFLITFHFK